MIYSLINLPFLLIALLVFWFANRRGSSVQAAPWWIAAAVMMLLTAIFDNAIIGFGLVDYDELLISGVRIGVAPIEDFAYTLAVVLMIPALWHAFERPQERG
jgi:lycopene cyclase domain-containing protein